MKTRVRDQVNALDAATFFNRLAMLMSDNPPARPDSVLVAGMATIGIVAGHPFDSTRLGRYASEDPGCAPERARQRIRAESRRHRCRERVDLMTNLGGYGAELDFRAYFADVGLDVNLPKDAIHEDERGRDRASRSTVRVAT